jgi:hypothetical protein
MYDPGFNPHPREEYTDKYDHGSCSLPISWRHRVNPRILNDEHSPCNRMFHGDRDRDSGCFEYWRWVFITTPRSIAFFRDFHPELGGMDSALSTRPPDHVRFLLLPSAELDPQWCANEVLVSMKLQFFPHVMTDWATQEEDPGCD